MDGFVSIGAPRSISRKRSTDTGHFDPNRFHFPSPFEKGMSNGHSCVAYSFTHTCSFLVYDTQTDDIRARLAALDQRTQTTRTGGNGAVVKDNGGMDNGNGNGNDIDPFYCTLA